MSLKQLVKSLLHSFIDLLKLKVIIQATCRMAQKIPTDSKGINQRVFQLL